MPRHCSVYGCFTNYKGRKRASTFTLPKTEPLRSLWLMKIPTDLSQLKNPYICIDHFKEEDIIRTDTVPYKGVMRTYPRKLPKLKEDAFPCIFPVIPDFMKENTTCYVSSNEDNCNIAIAEELKEYSEEKHISCLRSYVSNSDDTCNTPITMTLKAHSEEKSVDCLNDSFISDNENDNCNSPLTVELKAYSEENSLNSLDNFYVSDNESNNHITPLTVKLNAHSEEKSVNYLNDSSVSDSEDNCNTPVTVKLKAYSVENSVNYLDDSNVSGNEVHNRNIPLTVKLRAYSEEKIINCVDDINVYFKEKFNVGDKWTLLKHESKTILCLHQVQDDIPVVVGNITINEYLEFSVFVGKAKITKLPCKDEFTKLKSFNALEQLIQFIEEQVNSLGPYVHHLDKLLNC